MFWHKHFVVICSMFLLLVSNSIDAAGEESMYLSITTDKKLYYTGDIAVYTVNFRDSKGKLIDPDLIRATYDSQFVELQKVSDGVYKYVTKRLTQRDHQLGVYAEKEGYRFVQQSLTIRPVVTSDGRNNVKATAVEQGQLLKIRFMNNILSERDIYKIRLVLVGANVESVASSGWIKTTSQFGIDLKSVKGAIGPGDRQTINLLVDGKATMIVWSAYDLRGKRIDTGVEKVLA